jgi:O-antigen/teichoic acid export membrane protein
MVNSALKSIKLYTTQAHSGHSMRAYLLNILSASVPAAIIKLRGILVIPILVRALGLGQYGAWVQITIFMSTLALLGSLGLHISLIRFYPECKSELEQKDLILTILWITLLSSTALVIILWMFAPPLITWLLSDAIPTGLFRLSVLLVPLNAFNLVLLTIFRAKDKIQSYSTFKSLFGVADLVIVAGSVLLFQSLPALLWSTLLLLLVANLILALIHLKGWSIFPLPRPSLRTVGKYLKYSLPILPTSFSSELAARGDRLLVGFFLGPVAVGCYSVIYGLACLPGFLVGPTTEVLFPKLSHLQVTKEHATALLYLRATIVGTAALSLILLALIVLFRHFLWGLVTKSDATMLAGSSLASLLIIAGLGDLLHSINRIMQLGLYIDDKTQLVLLPYGTAAILNILMNILLIPAWNLKGAVSATLISYLCLVLVTLWLVHQRKLI